SVEDILSLCETNVQFSYLCQDESVWKMLTLRDFKGFQPERINTWKNTYQYYYNKVKRIEGEAEILFNDIVSGNTLDHQGYHFLIYPEILGSDFIDSLNLPGIDFNKIKKIVDSLNNQGEDFGPFLFPQITLNYGLINIYGVRTFTQPIINDEYHVILDIVETYPDF